MIQDKFKEDEELDFENDEVYNTQKKMQKLVEHQDDLIRLDKERLDNRLKLQTICKLMGSEAQTYFMYDCPRLKVASKIFYQLEKEQDQEFSENDFS